MTERDSASDSLRTPVQEAPIEQEELLFNKLNDMLTNPGNYGLRTVYEEHDKKVETSSNNLKVRIHNPGNETIPNVLNVDIDRNRPNTGIPLSILRLRIYEDSVTLVNPYNPEADEINLSLYPYLSYIDPNKIHKYGEGFSGYLVGDETTAEDEVLTIVRQAIAPAEKKYRDSLPERIEGFGDKYFAAVAEEFGLEADDNHDILIILGDYELPIEERRALAKYAQDDIIPLSVQYYIVLPESPQEATERHIIIYFGSTDGQVQYDDLGRGISGMVELQE